MKKIIVSYLVFLFGALASAQPVPKKLHADRAVQDYVNLLTDQEQLALNVKLKNYADSTSTGIVIAIVSDVEDDINFQAAQFLADWGIGQQGKDNGVLLLMAVNQRKIAISTGYGVEDRLTDAMSRRIINNDIIPYFRDAQYYQGFDAGTTTIMQVLSGAFKGQPATDDGELYYALIFFLFILVFFILVAVASHKSGGGNNNRSGGSGMDLTDFIILSQLGRSRSSGGFGGFGSSGGGFSGGGFGGFGGGMGGGGGASGSW
ncbi:MAG: TPM domain-containing protein [Capnocytophaga sp.]|nr:TPM domain-containing protein [Capnocytophaga sp.]